ncbi:hypothetical protein [Peribacillus simplex]
MVLVVNDFNLHGLGERVVIFAQLASPIGFKAVVFSPTTKWTIKKEIG